MSNEGAKILVVDDEPVVCELVSAVLEKERFRPLVAGDGRTAMETLRRERPDMIILDHRLPDSTGLELLGRIRSHDEDLPVVMITGYADIPGAVDAIRAGAHDYLAKPISKEQLILVVRGALADRHLRLKLKHFSRQPDAQEELTVIMGPSEAIGRLIAEINRVAKSNFSVVIIGETGSGKEVVARAIHQTSPRARSPFVPVDCGAIPESLLEGELFGYERGAFTGAVGSKRGKFEVAQGGTLFLDEILNLPLGSQAKLLRALQEKTIFRLGGTMPLRVNARVLVAASEDLEAAVASGAFRADLYYRLNEFTLRIPALRDRKEDIIHLAKRFQFITNRELNKTVREFSPGAVEALLSYPWPGNVRQLRATVRRAVLLADDVVTEEHLDIAHAETGIFPAGRFPVKVQEMAADLLSLRSIVAQSTEVVERAALMEALRRCQGNKAKAARLLQIDYKTMQLKLKKYRMALRKGNSYENQEKHE
jgi:two-component system nitrogen regulation response regulator GlnG